MDEHIYDFYRRPPLTDLHLLVTGAHVSGTEVRGNWPVVRFTLVWYIGHLLTFWTGLLKS